MKRTPWDTFKYRLEHAASELLEAQLLLSQLPDELKEIVHREYNRPIPIDYLVDILCSFQDVVEKMNIFSPEDAGCWFDSARGQYIGEAVIAVARSLGYRCDDDEANSNHEFYHETWDEAENFLQSFAPDGYYFGSSDHSCDWGLWKIEDEDADIYDTDDTDDTGTAKVILPPSG